MDRPHAEGMDPTSITYLSSWIKPRPSLAKAVTSSRALLITANASRLLGTSITPRLVCFPPGSPPRPTPVDNTPVPMPHQAHADPSVPTAIQPPLRHLTERYPEPVPTALPPRAATVIPLLVLLHHLDHALAWQAPTLHPATFGQFVPRFESRVGKLLSRFPNSQATTRLQSTY
jgi:hypothetical protein